LQNSRETSSRLLKPTWLRVWSSTWAPRAVSSLTIPERVWPTFTSSRLPQEVLLAISF